MAASLTRQAAIATLLQLTDEEKDHVISSVDSKVWIKHMDNSGVRFRIVITCAGMYWHSVYRIVQDPPLRDSNHIWESGSGRLELTIKRDHSVKKEQYWISHTRGNTTTRRICVDVAITKKVYIALDANLTKMGYDTSSLRRDYVAKWGERVWE